MSKRKRSDLLTYSPSPGEDAPASRALNRRRKLCAQRIESGEKAIASALRLGAGFERQKFSRRRKAAKGKGDDKASARLESEYAALKHLDLTKLAEQHLRRTIARVKSLREHEELPLSCKEIVKANPEVALLNVQARLCKVQAVKQQVDAVVLDLKDILGADGVTRPGIEKVDKGENKLSSSTAKAKAKDEDEDEDELGDDFSDDESDVFAALSSRIAAPSSGEEESDDSLSEGHRPPSVDYSEDEFQGFDDDEIVSGSGEDTDDAVPHDLTASTADLAETESEIETPPAPRSKSKPSSGRPSSSTFLPSLSHATYYSGTESEASDLDAEIGPKKNRRGQRARQKIWEQKYGEKAKHVQKEDRKRGWDSKRGAVDDRGGRGERKDSRNAGARMTGRGPERSGENATPLGIKKPKRDDVGHLHPSWAAAKAAKERKLDIKPSGKKIVFD